MNCGAVGVIRHRENIIRIIVTWDAPGPFLVAFGVDISPDVFRTLVLRGVDYNILKPQGLARIHDPYSDFAPVGYKNSFSEHVHL